MNPNQAPIQFSGQSLINGQPSTQISALDRGLAYGDGVFRTLPIKDGQAKHWELHYQKLVQDCKAINIRCPEAQVLLKDIQSLFASESGIAKIIITRGEGARGYGYPPDIQPNQILIKSPLAQYSESHYLKGIKLHLCKLRLSHQPIIAGIKHLNRLENVLARSEWTDSAIADGLLLDANDYVIECTMSNVFARFGTKLLTPRLTQCGVSGVTRERIIAFASQLNLIISEEDIPLNQFMQADEVVICNSLFGAWQVTEFNGKHWQKQSLSDDVNVLLAD